MSTKIYDAYKWNGSLLALLKDLGKIRELHRKYILSEGLGYFTCPPPPSLTPEEVRKIIRDDNTQGLASQLNVDGSAVIYVRPRGIYVQFFTEVRVDNRKGYKDWHYQDSCDRPDDVPAKEWYQRKKFWEGIFNYHSQGYNSPKMTGLTYEFADWRLESELREAINAHLWPERFGPKAKPE